MSKLKDKRIILVDDNDIDILVNSKLLQIASISKDVVSFNSGNDVVEYFTKNLEELFCLSTIILMDIQMPEMDGFETINLLCENFKDTAVDCQIYMLSSSIDRSDIKRAEENPYILKVLEKPLDVYQLKGLLDI